MPIKASDGDFYFFTKSKGRGPYYIIRVYTDYTGSIKKVYHGDEKFTIDEWLTKIGTDKGYWSSSYIRTPR